MSKPKGNFTCGDLVQVKVKIDQVWSDAVANRIQFIANVKAFQELKSRQTNTMEILQDSKKKNTVRVHWLSDCEPDAPILTDDRCIAGGNEVSADCNDYELNEFDKRGFTVSETDFETSLYEWQTVLAFGMMRRMKQLDEAIGVKVITALATFVGTNRYTGGVGSVSGATTTIPAAAWTPNIMGYFAKVMQINRFNSAFLLSGDNLFDAAWLVSKQTTDPKGQSDQAKFQEIALINDLFTMESTLPGVSLLVSPSAYQFVTRHRESTTPREITNGANMILYSQASKNIPGLVYDVTYKTRCANDEIFHDFGITAHWDFLQNPLDCDTRYTNVLKFICG